MPAGLQVWDATGRQTVEITDRITRISGSGSTQSNVAGSMVIPNAGGTGGSSTPFYVLLTTPQYPYSSPVVSRMPTFYISGTTLVWSAAEMPAAFLVGWY